MGKSLRHKRRRMKAVFWPEKLGVVVKLIDEDLDALLVTLFGIVVNGGDFSRLGLVHLLERPKILVEAGRPPHVDVYLTLDLSLLLRQLILVRNSDVSHLVKLSQGSHACEKDRCASAPTLLRTMHRHTNTSKHR